jgi:transcriptional regulator with XRE-family HTH domain
MITGTQIRAARAMVGWSAHQLAERSGISYSAIQRAEAVDGVPSMRAPNLLWALQKALEAAKEPGRSRAPRCYYNCYNQSVGSSQPRSALGSVWRLRRPGLATLAALAPPAL